ncbi:hypothetical protein BO82DRAFT_364668 [Aspergillus uvarum CBS 121591]|uniref:Uncharacterized protein n=1 Tax=Aspergillus uvarum CBS 121591 TaxID=1448315 RepID=A0A319C950_9EURO|nr:hypothetical protein BO82DRAFT_364668 [Aspergillus uvarum CBS 121591]PYH81764.1 hypothetical protein BO82DRAFT_364668 [Aspergillus uvarum CBS 121591]
MPRPEQYAHNLGYLMLRDLKYAVYACWEDELRSLLTFSLVGGSQIPGNVTKQGARRHRAAIHSRFAGLYREMQRAGRLGQTLLSPVDEEEDGIGPRDVEDLLEQWAQVSVGLRKRTEQKRTEAEFVN